MFKKGKSGASTARTRANTRITNGEPDKIAAIEAELHYDEAPDDGDHPSGSAEDTARYIAEMVGALAAMAGEARLDLLTYLLNMARVEAELQARQSEDVESSDSDD
jgi:hypothetical protein